MSVRTPTNDALAAALFDLCPKQYRPNIWLLLKEIETESNKAQSKALAAAIFDGLTYGNWPGVHTKESQP